MKSERVNDWLQLVGMLGIIASLVFVGMQVRQSQTIGEGESAASFFNSTVAGRQLLVDNADVWTRGCMGEEMSVADDAKFAQLYRAYSMGSYFAWVGTQSNILKLNPQDIVYPFAANIHRYPGFARLGVSWMEWAAEGSEDSFESGLIFRKAIEERVAELQRIEPNPDYDVRWCGS